jgi:hypothetical protein
MFGQTGRKSWKPARWPDFFNSLLEYGIVIRLKNMTVYSLSEVVILIHNKNTGLTTRYSATTFTEPLVPGALLTGSGEPALTQIIKPGETRRFFVHINEAASNPTAFRDNYGWDVTATKGIPQK